MDGVKKFEREDRYIVIKRKHLPNLPAELQIRLKPALEDAASLLPQLECVVIESDWPEYNFVWLMLEHRMGGYPGPDFNAVKCAADVQAALVQYKADLYDEVWQKAKGIGFMNVTMALEQVAALREELASLTTRYQSDCTELSDSLTAAEQRNAALTEALMIYTGQHERSQSVGHVEMLNIAQAALSGSLSTPPKESMVLAAWALTLNGEINANWMTAGPSKSSAEGLRDNYISRSRPCNLPKLELVPLYRVKPTESGASDKCVSDGGTCGLGGHCGECPHKESGASE